MFRAQLTVDSLDVASAVAAALAAPQGYAAYNIASPRSASVNEVLKTLVTIDGFGDAEIVHKLDRPSGASALHVSSAEFALRFNWQPARSLEEGLSETVKWYRRNVASAR